MAGSFSSDREHPATRIALLVSLLASAIAIPTAANAYGPLILLKLSGLIAARTGLIDYRANRAYRLARRSGSCSERAGHRR